MFFAARRERARVIDGTIVIDTGTGPRTVHLESYLGPDAEEAAHAAEYAWIKQLRHATVDGTTFRLRFTARGDSLWWFSEIYLHRQRAILDIYRAIAAAEALIQRERPLALRVIEGSPIVRDIVPQVAFQRKIGTIGRRVSRAEWWRRLVRLRARARLLTLTAAASRLPFRRTPHVEAAAIAVFVHRAFWRSDADDGSGESYIGPVLEALERRAGVAGLSYVGLGPSSNFRARGWWPSPGGPDVTTNVVPVERYAHRPALRASRRVWAARRRNERAMIASADLRAAASMRGIDCWPIVREQLTGIAWLQWPWSVKAMDEAGAALDAVRPAAAVTYAEAGGWGRALVLEARRRGISSVGLQHGFIYRHWLNYLHEPDEVQPAGEHDGGFPLPTVTLVFDEHSAMHLRDRGRLPADALRVTGSPKLDALMESIRTLSADAVAAARRAAGVEPDAALVLVTTKEREARRVLPALIDAAEVMGNVTLVIKPHPAETSAAYDNVAAGRRRVRVLSPAAPLAPMLAASRALVTVNSTLALDAAAAGVPALVLGLPNNLSPFVDAGALAGALTTSEIPEALRRILYDEGFRQQLAGARSAFLERYAIGSDGFAAARSAEAVLEVLARSRAQHDGEPGMKDKS